jgi:hypothetical protein
VAVASRAAEETSGFWLGINIGGGTGGAAGVVGEDVAVFAPCCLAPTMAIGILTLFNPAGLPCMVAAVGDPCQLKGIRWERLNNSVKNNGRQIFEMVGKCGYM